MYRLMVSLTKDNFGLSKSKDFYLSTPVDVCEVLKALSGISVLFTLTEVELSSVDSVVLSIKDF